MILITEIDISIYKKARPIHLEILPATVDFTENHAGGGWF
jgi:hypothetical protein